MKNIFKNSTLLLLGIALFSACKKEDMNPPDFTISVNPQQAKVGEPVVISITGDAESFTVFTGDPGAEYSKSHAYINAGKDIDYQDYWLPQEKVEAAWQHVIPSIDWHNTKALTDQSLPFVDKDAIRDSLSSIADVHFSNAELFRSRVFSILIELSDVKLLSNQLLTYTENANKEYMPEGGYATGHAIARYVNSLTYTYDQPGTYTITVIGTSVSRKKYSGDGYNTDRVTHENEYDYNRLIREYVLTVE